MTDVDDRTFTIAVVLGFVLVLLGVVAYVVTDFASVTALIPTLFGIAIVTLGLVGLRTDRGDRASTGIALLAILGVLGSARVVPDLIALAGGDEDVSVVATASQTLMILIGLALVALVVVDELAITD